MIQNRVQIARDSRATRSPLFAGGRHTGLDHALTPPSFEHSRTHTLCLSLTRGHSALHSVAQWLDTRRRCPRWCALDLWLGCPCGAHQLSCLLRGPSILQRSWPHAERSEGVGAVGACRTDELESTARDGHGRGEEAELSERGEEDEVRQDTACHLSSVLALLH